MRDVPTARAASTKVRGSCQIQHISTLHIFLVSSCRFFIPSVGTNINISQHPPPTANCHTKNKNEPTKAPQRPGTGHHGQGILGPQQEQQAVRTDERPGHCQRNQLLEFRRRSVGKQRTHHVHHQFWPQPNGSGGGNTDTVSGWLCRGGVHGAHMQGWQWRRELGGVGGTHRAGGCQRCANF